MLSKLYHQLPPVVLNGLRYLYAPNHRQAQRERRVEALTQEYLPKLARVTGNQIHSALFAGMRYIQRAICSALPPKLIGSYEKELWGCLETAVKGCACIVDIGAAEGYYAVGLAMKCPQAKVIAYEATAEGRTLLAELAALNEVKHIELRGLCCIEDMAVDTAEATAATLVLCDAEGAEFHLLDPEQAPGLRHSKILVELHPWVEPTVKEVLVHRFEKTHTITVIAAHPRVQSDFPVNLIPDLAAEVKLALMSEGRPEGMEWLWMQPIR